MKKFRLLGVGLLLGMIAVAPCRVFAESVAAESSEQVEVISTEETSEESEAMESSENLQNDVQESSTEEETVAPDITEKRQAKIANELKIWDVVYDAENDQITGKTEPNADVLIIHVNTGNSNGGTLRADASGIFTYSNPVAGVIKFEAYLDGRKSEQYEIKVKEPNVEKSLNITYVSYDIGTQTFNGATAPNVTIYAIIPGKEDQNVVTANSAGLFSVTDQFEPGTEIILTAGDGFGNEGEPFHYTIPSEAFINSMKIKNVSYDHATHTLTGETAPNASIGLWVMNGAYGTYQADENGKFTIVRELEAGTAISLKPFHDGIFGEKYEYTIPAVPIKAGTTDSTSTVMKPAGTKEFPKTGATVNAALSIIGSFAVLVAAVLIITRKLAGKKN
ncbi:LPXTG cell wall anchor domain-containing protein [Enterococcus sp. BWM-S5]|uniref:LPXTG cell wall anchor domain-containing protein n=1 Tax=Enterococcus larvae TaxID=2794352 RepID=A0ABS4CMW1_9ENTE|nr:LPXTG cell wall anchor domain-containing protein [Enterococcus larvae]